MIQRIQSVWLTLAALVNVSLFYLAIFKGDVIKDGIAFTEKLIINNHLPSLLIALVAIVLPVVAIFMFRNRKRQLSMSVMAKPIVCVVS